MDVFAETTTQYAEFAAHAAPASPCFHDWATRVSTDGEVLEWINALPVPKRQPHLVFAAARWHGVPAPGPYDALRSALLDDWDTIRGTVMARSTQTNEVGRLAALVPVFARLDGPLALIEVGASAGLCLYPDRWGYAWTFPDGRTVTAGPEPRLACEVTGEPPLPAAPPEVAWLQVLVWPEQVARRDRLAAAIEVARAEPPYLREGNLLEALPVLLDEVP